ncbi:kinase-like domain-containing protein [Crucibulum laeve]|uniref:non-specific serine/threonine protein kinase n=1 Tax=Crucibulum laeve TaxID=68775 RepID=A0A5C3MA39_9AGAR|nr:kinase-like domain-containing protein [Crucibulum laeve]
MSVPPSPSRGVVALIPSMDSEWHPILHSSNQVVLYNPRSHAISISYPSDVLSRRPRQSCPYCKQTLPPGFEPDINLRSSGIAESDGTEPDIEIDSMAADPNYHSRDSNYFRFLAIANETSSRPPSPGPNRRGPQSRSAFPVEAMAEGYFKTFFQEEYKLGMGANGSVFLCQHMLDGNPLGHFAVKKIAVGDSHSYLLNILKEVRLLERLHHPNIITYHHAWLETCQFSSFGPKVPTLHVLMQWAEGGSLDDFIDVRLGRKPQHIHINPLAPFDSSPSPLPNTPSPSPSPFSPNPLQAETHSRSARIRAFRAFQRAPPAEKERMRRDMEVQQGQWTAVHLLSAEEMKSLFKDVVEGLAFLHDKSILHLDLKPGNVLLTWDEGKLIPRAMLSDFGTSRDMVSSSRTRSGNTGTLEYASPESLPSPQTGLLRQIDSKADMWSLGMILHKLLFFKLPYRYAAEGDADETAGTGRSDVNEATKLQRLEREVLEYPGFKSTSALVTSFEARRLSRAFLVLLESLLNKAPGGRPTAERVSIAIRDGKLDPLRQASSSLDTTISELVPLSRIRSRASDEDTALHDPRFEMDMATERTRLLGLPSPPLPEKEVSLSQRWLWQVKSWTGLSTGAEIGVRRRRIPRRMWMRLWRSCLLVAKVLTIPSLCPSPSSSPRLAIASVLLGAAVIDTVLEPLTERQGMWTSIGLALFHVGILRLGQTGWWCCV